MPSTVVSGVVSDSMEKNHTPPTHPSARHVNSSTGGMSFDRYRRPPSTLWQQIKVGPYLLLQTLGKGEFGKVKLGIHIESGQEFAVKLIKKESVSYSASRMTKVQREIQALQSLKHPNIIKLFDVIENEKYIAIILEYASGGALLEHIMSRRFLKEKDAQRMFAQLVSSIHYMHCKGHVHRDLKLENLLLDRYHNILVSDFGFANRFMPSQDLMATSCGSPCYAAPELVINEGLYAGTAVDIWSCGVILYAMLCGHLPFNDDPDNPKGKNIGLLYRYILATSPVFPSHVSAEAQDLVQKMLVPDPNQRCTLQQVMQHAWLEQHHELFALTVDGLEAKATSMTEHVSIPKYRKVTWSKQDATSESKNNRDVPKSSDSSSNEPSAATTFRSDTAQSVPVTFERQSNELKDGRKTESDMHKISKVKTPLHIVDSHARSHRRDRLFSFITGKFHSVAGSIDQNSSNSDIPSTSLTSVHNDSGATTRHTLESPRHESEIQQGTYQDKTKLPTVKLPSKFMTNLRSHFRELSPMPTPVPVCHKQGSLPLVLRKQPEAAPFLPTTLTKDSVVGEKGEPVLDASDLSIQPESTLSSHIMTASTTITSEKATYFRGWRNRASLNLKRNKNSHREPEHARHSLPTSAEAPEKSATTQKMMQWFKRKPQGKNEPQVVPFTGQPDHTEYSICPTECPTRTSSGLVSQPLASSLHATIPVYEGPVNHNALTSAAPNEVMSRIQRTLRALGIDVVEDGGYKMICCRRGAKEMHAVQQYSVGCVAPTPFMSEITSTSVEDKDFYTEQPSSNVSACCPVMHTQMPDPPNPCSCRPQQSNIEPPFRPSQPAVSHESDQDIQQSSAIYGDPSVDSGEEIRFIIEVCSFRNLSGICIIDMRRLLGSTSAFKFIYHKLFNLLDLPKIDHLPAKTKVLRQIGDNTVPSAFEHSAVAHDSDIRQSSLSI